EEERGERRAHPRLADDRADEGRPAADQAHRTEEAPARQLRLARHRADDPEALGRVVQAEADDQDDREADLAGRGRLADREPLAEVVEADAGRDQEREPAAAGERLEPRHPAVRTGPGRP